MTRKKLKCPRLARSKNFPGAGKLSDRLILFPHSLNSLSRLGPEVKTLRDRDYICPLDRRIILTAHGSFKSLCTGNSHFAFYFFCPVISCCDERAVACSRGVVSLMPAVLRSIPEISIQTTENGHNAGRGAGLLVSRQRHLSLLSTLLRPVMSLREVS